MHSEEIAVTENSLAHDVDSAHNAATWFRKADKHRPNKLAPLARIDLGTDGYVDLIDERDVRPDGQIVVVAVGRQAGERARFLITKAGATPHELFTAMAREQHVPLRLVEDHRDRAARDPGVPREPRTFSRSAVFRNFTGPTLGRTTFYEIFATDAENDFEWACNPIPTPFFTHWANYDTGAVEDHVTWPQGYAFIHNATQRALGLCYYQGSDAGATINVWIESGLDDTFYPTIWSDTFPPGNVVWFKTGTYLSKGISHLHWDDLEPGTGEVRLVGTWSES
jgi:hypothetical protein